MRPKQKATLLEWRRRRAIALLRSGLSFRAIARLLDCSLSSVERWQRTYKINGLTGLKVKPIPGRPPKIAQDQKRKLLQCLRKGALAAGFPTEIWTLRRIARVIGHLFGIGYKVNYVWYLMRALNWSCQQPAKKARERKEQQIQNWKDHVWPHIKKC